MLKLLVNYWLFITSGQTVSSLVVGGGRFGAKWSLLKSAVQKLVVNTNNLPSLWSALYPILLSGYKIGSVGFTPISTGPITTTMYLNTYYYRKARK